MDHVFSLPFQGLIGVIGPRGEISDPGEKVNIITVKFLLNICIYIKGMSIYPDEVFS